MSSAQATPRASDRSSSVQQRPVRPVSPEWSQSCIERPTTSCPSSLRSRAATEESTPPDMATAIRTRDIVREAEGGRREAEPLQRYPLRLTPNAYRPAGFGDDTRDDL